MKLLYILGSYFPAQSGGPNNTIHWQAKSLCKKDFDVTVASLKSGLTKENVDEHNIILNDQNVIQGVKAYYFNYRGNRFFSLQLYLWMVINIKKYDFIQLTSYFFPITWFAALLCNIYSVPFSLAPRGELEDNALKYNKKFKKIIHKYFLKKLYKKSSFILVTSSQELGFSRKYFPSNMKFELIPNYIDLNTNKQVSDELIKNKKDILYLGRLHPKKGIENLIKAYMILGEDITKSNSLLIVGSGNSEYEKKLKLLALNDKKYKNKIFFLGHKQGKEKENLYRNSKVFVLPSYSENFGNVVLESLSLSTPVISSKFTPWRELEVAQCGFLSGNNPDELKNKIEYIFKMNSKEYIRYCNNSYKFVHDKYDVDKNISYLAGIYRMYTI
ncbi:glycosyltransferase [Candidatus Thioglobus sp.]|nr:glycosyltransferase [Candidatus Thioglobus sp.]